MRERFKSICHIWVGLNVVFYFTFLEKLFLNMVGILLVVGFLKRKNWLKIILKLKTNKIISLILNIKRITKMILMVMKLLMIIKKIRFKNKLSMIIKIIKCNYRFLKSTKLLKLNLYLVFKQLKKLRYQKEKEMKDLWSRRNSATKIRCFYLTNKLIDLNSCHIKLKI